jgi:hypothetical protein
MPNRDLLLTGGRSSLLPAGKERRPPSVLTLVARIGRWLALVLFCVGGLGIFVSCARTAARTAAVPTPAPRPAAPAPPPPPQTRPAPAPSGAALSGVLPAPPQPEQNNVFGHVRPASELEDPEARAVSPDGTHVATARKASVWLSDPDGKNGREVLDAATAKVDNPPDGTSLAATSGVYDLAFSPNGKHLYFQADGWGTSLALYYLDVDQGRVRFVHDANGYSVIQKCTAKNQVGRLIILEHRYFDPIPASAVDWYFLIDDQAKRFGIVGPEPENVARFLARTCGLGHAPPAPAAQRIPAKLARKSVRCGDALLRRKPIPFLDGTSLELFLYTSAQELRENPKVIPMAVSVEDAEHMIEGC